MILEDCNARVARAVTMVVANIPLITKLIIYTAIQNLLRIEGRDQRRKVVAFNKPWYLADSAKWRLLHQAASGKNT